MKRKYATPHSSALDANGPTRSLVNKVSAVELTRERRVSSCTTSLPLPPTSRLRCWNACRWRCIHFLQFPTLSCKAHQSRRLSWWWVGLSRLAITCRLFTPSLHPQAPDLVACFSIGFFESETFYFHNFSLPYHLQRQIYEIKWARTIGNAFSGSPSALGEKKDIAKNK